MSHPAPFSEYAVLLGGLAHTGKTQLRTVLTTIPGIEIFRETHLLRLDGSRFGDLSVPANLDRCLRMLESHEPLPVDRSGLIEAFRAGPARFEALVVLIYQKRATELGAHRWGLQMSSLESRAPAVLDLLPEAHMVQLIRHPSRHRSDRGGANPVKRTIELSRWRESVELGLALARNHPDRYRIVRTEDLAGDPHSIIGEVCDFLRLERVSAGAIDGVDWARLVTSGTDGPLDPATASAADELGFERSQETMSMRGRMGQWPGQIAWNIVKLRKGRAVV
jgi:hypothetical protein